MGGKYLRTSTGTKEQCGLRDMISQLPDEVLVSLLSLLTLKEAGSTSVLAKRWRNLWTQKSRLEFIDEDTWDIRFHMKRRVSEPKFVEWVNQVLASHKSQNLEVFRVWFNLDEKYKSDIDKWVKFAFQRRVQQFELDLSSNGRGANCALKNLYTLSCELLHPSEPSSSSMLYVGFGSLRALCLKGINVTGEVLHYFLSKCRFLERLSIIGCRKLVNVKVVGQSLMLKYLHIQFCDEIQSIEMCDVNVVTFIYVGVKTRILLKNVSKLVDLTIGGNFCNDMMAILPYFSSCLPQIKMLMVEALDFKWKFNAFHVCELSNLKTLVLKCFTKYDRSILDYSCFIKASPFLRKFVLEVAYHGAELFDGSILMKADQCGHRYLEELEFRGYYGGESDLQVVIFFLKNAAALKKIVIDPREARVMTMTTDIQENVKAARKRAKEQLQGRVPLGVQLIIL